MLVASVTPSLTQIKVRLSSGSNDLPIRISSAPGNDLGRATRQFAFFARNPNSDQLNTPGCSRFDKCAAEGIIVSCDPGIAA